MAMRSTVEGAACFAAGLLLDLDHLYDYWRHGPRKNTWSDFVDACENCRLERIYLMLHSWELSILLTAAALLWGGTIYGLWGFAAGIISHLIADQISNPVRPYSYFILYRFHHGFHRNYFFDERVSPGGLK